MLLGRSKILAATLMMLAGLCCLVPALAQSPYPQSPYPDNSGPPPPRWNRPARGGPMQELNLSAEQHQRMRALMQDHRAKMQRLQNELDQNVRTILTPQQYQKYQEMRQQRRQQWQQGRGGYRPQWPNQQPPQWRNQPPPQRRDPPPQNPDE